MGLEKRTIWIISITAIVIVAAVIGLAVGLRPSSSIQLELIPQPSSGSNFIYYNSSDSVSLHNWTKVIDDSLAEYRTRYENRVSCSWMGGIAGEGQVCDVPLDTFSPCTRQNDYGFERRSLCVFLKINKVLNWIPEPYNGSTDMPENLPEDLRVHMKVVSGKPEANVVWVSCDGEDAVDMENIGPVQYIPRRGFPSYYFPYTVQDGYLSPLVAVYFERPRADILIRVKCKLWAKNIAHADDEPSGSVDFELMVV